MQDPMIGSQINVYRVERLLGRGGMASVYFAWDTHQDRPVALKILDDRYREIPASVKRFIQEAQTIAAWDHPHIVHVLDAGADQGVYYYAMEFIRGLDLAQLLHQYQEAGHLLPYDEVLRIGWAISKALDFAHQNGLIHRDVKPSNILVSVDGRILLSDFGLVMDVAVGTMGETFGSPHYIAPEQARRSSNAVPQSDIYSLGVVLYEMLTGVVPFHDPSPAALALKHLAEAPPLPRTLNPRLSQGVEAVLLRALRKSPAERYATGREMMAALEHALSSASPQAEDSPALLIPAETVRAGAGRQPPFMAGGGRPPDGAAFRPSVYAQSVPRSSIPGAPPLQPAPQQRRRLSGWGCLGLILAFVTLAGLASAALALSRPDWLNLPGLFATTTPRPTGFAPPTLTPTTQQTNTAAPTLTLTPLPTASATLAPTLTPTPTSPPTETAEPPTPTPLPPLSFIIVHLEETGFVLANLGEAPLPMEPLEIWDNDPEIDGAEWEVEMLQPGQCVLARDEDDESRLPGDLGCEIVGETVTRRGRSRVWTRTMNVRYAGEEVAACRTEDLTCEIEFSQE